LADKELRRREFVGLVACGTSYHAALIGQLFGNGSLGLPVWAADSSNYGPLDLNKKILDNSSVFYITQSGETADTLNSLKLIQEHSQALNLGIVNVVGSSLARQVRGGVYTRAGTEIGVAASKTFLNQTLTILLAEIYLADIKGKGFPDRQAFFQDLKNLPQKINATLDNAVVIKKIAEQLVGIDNFMFLGRHLSYPLALEGALKLKEISYKFSYGSALGSLKHGPLALIGKNNAAIIIAFRRGPDLKKSLSNIQEIIARHGRVIIISDIEPRQLPTKVAAVIPLPQLRSLWLAPLIAAPALQLLAYYLAISLGREIDKPRHLAKSVTVI